MGVPSGTTVIALARNVSGKKSLNILERPPTCLPSTSNHMISKFSRIGMVGGPPRWMEMDGGPYLWRILWIWIAWAVCWTTMGEFSFGPGSLFHAMSAGGAGVIFRKSDGCCWHCDEGGTQGG